MYLDNYLLLNHAKSSERIWMKFGIQVGYDLE